MTTQTHTAIDKAKLTEQLLAAVESHNLEQIKDLFSHLVEEEIAEILESTPLKERQILWEAVESTRQGEILTHTNDEVTANLLGSLEAHEIVEITEDLETDDIADIAQSLDSSDQQTLLASLDEGDRNAVEMALTYPEDTAGGLMSTDLISVRADVSLDVVLRYLRTLGELPESTAELFVRDREGKFVGSLKLTVLLTHDEDTLVQTVLDSHIPGIRAFTPAKEVAHFFEKNDLLSAAVVNETNQILGRITIDDVVDIIREEAEHAQMASAGLDEDEDIFAPASRAAKRRTFWLGINLLTAIFASMVIGLFDASIEKIVALAILMPIIASMGGIAGTQTATIVIRALATGKLARSNSRSLLIKETTVGLFNGVIWAVLTGLAVLFWFSDVALSLIFASAMLINLLVAAFAGAMIPLILQRMKIDPALASGLMLTTVTDSLGFFVFLGLATIVLL
ncbi:magnesium transporter [Thiomicrorhabdus lithotrophica]|uniref:Magnesium transporter MgtE n=1 Tax=Thiomicrorhabdus lithotrophica TaxID=2949997 RepID=A0ABY8CEH4_9GAMM|nr:magnesium transporter [Thiomicrorhabdus lithotrophica]WEJ63187.1 magnesium transporter [Thiomicrorhabdus lithotrophica]